VVTYATDVYTTIHAALVKWLEAMDGVPTHPDTGRLLIAYEATNFKPVDGTLWLRETFAPSPEPTKTLGGNRISTVRGSFRIDVFGPKGDGSGRVATLADSVMRRFAVGSSSAPSHEGQEVRIAAIWRDAGVITRNSYFVPITARWYAFTDKL
jgi:hypothetical protein